MTTPATIRVRRADGTEVDLPAETKVYVQSGYWHERIAIGMAYEAGARGAIPNVGTQESRSPSSSPLSAPRDWSGSWRRCTPLRTGRT